MDANGYTPTPVVTPRSGSTQPAILADAAQGVFDPEYGVSQNVKQKITGLLSGVVASTNAAEDAYALLLSTVCEHYAGPMGYLFAEDVTSSLLMPQGLLAQGSILSRIVDEMDNDACTDVEVLGWLYQFYIAERKDEYFASKKKATAADIPAATQLFTPKWIVDFLAENSLGRLWMLNNPGSELAGSMEYYIASEGDEPHAEVASADEIRVLDPACGSGHILVFAFDLLYRMYEEEGWPIEDIPEMILRNNLFGLEIDRRAAEIASFALEMKARECDTLFFERDIDANIHVLEPVVLLPQELELVPQLADRKGLLDAMEHLDEVGSLYVPDPLDESVLANELEHVERDGSIFADSVISKLGVMLGNVRALSQSFHCVIANPPYMGSGNMNTWLSGWVKTRFPDEKSDLCTCFISRGLLFTKAGCYASLVTMHSWMFLGSYVKMREKIISGKGIVSMAHLGARAFDAIGGEVVQTSATVFTNMPSMDSGSYVRLVNPDNAEKKRMALIEAINNPDCGWFYRANAKDFGTIPGTPLVYWASKGAIRAFRQLPKIGNVIDARVGLITGDVNRFLKRWPEVNFRAISFGCLPGEKNPTKWVPVTKGGEFRRWYGNNDFVLNWENDGWEMKNDNFDGDRVRAHNFNGEQAFKEGISWSTISSSVFHCRYVPNGFMFDTAGPFSEVTDSTKLWYILALMSSSTYAQFMQYMNPTMNFPPGYLESVPFAYDSVAAPIIDGLSRECVEITRSDWDATETSWDFIRHPMSYVNAEGSTRITDTYARWEAECRERFDRLKANEEELNRIFARIYHMEGEVPIEVPADKVSVRLAERSRDARSLISYIVGCIFGRYSWECGALAIANQGDTVEDYCSWSRVAGEDLFFLPDYDNVLPVLADEWFDDDLVAGIRRWLTHAYGEETLGENVAWLEESLGKDLRSYLVKDFYTDHLRVYQKRPIYWMFQSPKRTFQCLVYMHRYDEGTVGTILTGYLRPLEDKLRARLQVLESPSASAADAREANRVRSQIAELEQWEREVIYPLAHERVSIDLDDGVKINYNKFPRALAKVPGLSTWK